LSIDESSFFNGELYTIITEAATNKKLCNRYDFRAKTVTAALEEKS
jgi:hypothetical protein